eukprot:m51a1_g12444 hypothetical protein (570) ;mRNA; f:850722-861126
MGRPSVPAVPAALALCAAAAVLSLLPAYSPTAWSLIESQGYRVELHRTTTADGYHVSAYRRAPPPSAPRDKPSPAPPQHRPGIPGRGAPVLLVHGLLSSAMAWVANSRESALPFLLSDAGYDVYIANLRGTANATGHERLGAEDPRYWDWSFAEKGLYDVPALVDLALRVSRKSSLVLVGHSQGTSDAIIALSMAPGLSSKVSFFLALAPVVKASTTYSWPFILSKAVNMGAVTRALGGHKICGTTSLLNSLGAKFCGVAPLLCQLTFNSIAGWSWNADTARQALYIASSDCTSAKDFSHGYQAVHSGRFALYDYGPSVNIRKYGTKESPGIPYKNITTPTAIFYAGRDILVLPQDTERFLIQELRPEALSHVPPRKMHGWNHLDFLWARDSTEFRLMVDLCKKFAPSANHDLAAAVLYLHEHGVVHGDIKSPNALLRGVGAGAASEAKLCDLGTAAALLQPGGRRDGWTTRWCAPEVLRGRNAGTAPSRASDAYSFGVVLWELATCRMPFYHVDTALEATIVGGEALSLAEPGVAHSGWGALIARCLHPDPRRRPTFHDIVLTLGAVA